MGKRRILPGQFRTHVRLDVKILMSQGRFTQPIFGSDNISGVVSAHRNVRDLDQIIFLALFQFTEMFACVANFFEFE